MLRLFQRSLTNRWMNRQRLDKYVLQAKREGYRSRAVYKLKQINAKTRPPLLRRGQVALELGAAPGSWTQVLLENGMRVVAVDVLPMESMDGEVTFVQGDFTEDAVQEQLLEAIGNHGKADLILSDLSPNRSGQRSLDEARMIDYAEHSINLAHRCLRPGGHWLTKLLQGSELAPLLKRVKPLFKAGGELIKPPASRKESAEVYLLARGFRPKGTKEHG